MIKITKLSEIISSINPNTIYSQQQLEQIGVSVDVLEKMKKDTAVGRFLSSDAMYGAFVLNAISRNRSGKRIIKNRFANAEQLTEIAQISLTSILSKHLGGKPLVSEIQNGHNGTRTTFLGIDVTKIHYLVREQPKSPLTEAVIKYKQTQSIDDFNELYRKAQTLVTYLAERIASKLPKCVDVDELICAGYDGLRNAIEKFEPERELEFKTYATFKIRGAILDYIRYHDLVPILARRKVAKIEKATKTYLSTHNQAPTLDELSDLTGISVQDIIEETSGVKSFNMLYLDSQQKLDDDKSSYARRIEQSTEPNPLETLIQNETREIFWQEVDRICSPKEKEALIMHMLEGKTMYDIGKSLDLSESRISQLITKTITRLRNNTSTKKLVYQEINNQQPTYVDGQEVIIL